MVNQLGAAVELPVRGTRNAQGESREEVGDLACGDTKEQRQGDEEGRRGEESLYPI